MDLNKILDENLQEVQWKYLAAGIIFLAALIAVMNLDFTTRNVGNKSISDITVNIEVVKLDENISQQVRLDKNSTVLQLLNKSYSIKYKKSKFGYYITSIDGLSSNKTHFWIYLVNGTPPSKGVGQYRLQESTNVTFLYLTSNQSQKYFK
ncbi:MAG: DUF4430 domain-containing protein [Candidatus Nanohaloarchaea archaeon]